MFWWWESIVETAHYKEYGKWVLRASCLSSRKTQPNVQPNKTRVWAHVLHSVYAAAQCVLHSVCCTVCIHSVCTQCVQHSVYTQCVLHSVYAGAQCVYTVCAAQCVLHSVYTQCVCWCTHTHSSCQTVGKWHEMHGRMPLSRGLTTSL